MITKELDVAVISNMAASCEAKLKRDEVEGHTAKDVINKVISECRQTVDTELAANAITGVINSKPVVDVNIEVLRGDKNYEEAGDPIKINDIVIDEVKDESEEKLEKITIKLSKDYYGG